MLIMVSRVAQVSHPTLYRVLTQPMHPGKVEAGGDFGDTGTALGRKVDTRNGGCMRASQPLRFYANPVKLLLLLLVSTMFVAAGFWILREPAISAKPSTTLVAWLAIGFFGLGVIVFLIQILHDVVFRQPALQIDGLGWTYHPPLWAKKQTAYWQDIDHVAIYYQWMRESQIRHKPQYTYYLVVHGIEPRIPAHVSRFSRVAMRLYYRHYPELEDALMAAPLNNLFVRTTPEKVERVLERISTTYDVELRLYDILVDTEIRPL